MAVLLAVLFGEVAFAFDVSADLDRYAVDRRRNDVDLKIIVLRTIAVAGVDSQRIAIDDFEFCEFRAALHQRDALGRAMLVRHRPPRATGWT